MNTSDNRPYIFISYAHADRAKVLPAINALQNNKVNLWYDNGIVAGSEWPEFIAEKVMNCKSFVLFVSRSYLESQNCKRELNFAISRKKNILSIFLEEVELSPGMEMQLGSYQAIFRNRFPSDKAFHDSLSVESFFNSCKVAEDETVDIPENKKTVSNQNDYNSGMAKNTDNSGVFGDNAFSSLKDKSANKASGSPRVMSKKNKYIAGILAIFLAPLGINYFYLRSYLYGILSLVLYWTYIPTIVNMVLGFRYMFMSNENFQRKVAKKAHPWEYFSK